MRNLFLVAILATVALSGCLNDESDPEVQNTIPEETPGLLTNQTVSIYQGANVSMQGEIPAEFLNGTYHINWGHTGYAGAEPNIGITSENCAFVSAFEDILRSCDLGQNWTRVYTQQIGTTSDPMLWVDPITDRIFSPQMFPVLLCSNHIFSDDNGDSWTETPMACGTPVVDHQKLATGPYPASIPVENPLYSTVTSYCYNKLTSTNCAFSFDGGLTYAYDVVASAGPFVPQVGTSLVNCGGINGHQHHDNDGTIYVPLGLNCGRAHVAISDDLGLNWRVVNLGAGTSSIDPEVTSTPDGTVYYMHRNAQQVTQLFRSSDKFVTVEGPFQMSPPELTNTVFAGLTSGADGNIAASYLGTYNGHGGSASQAPDNTTWHLFVSQSVNAHSDNITFVTTQVTPDDDPVQRGCVWLGGGGTPCRNMLDFIDMHSGPDGRYWVGFTDGCVSDKCVSPNGTAQDSRARQAAYAVLQSGPGLLGARVE